jgi:hypothetical protein
MSFIVIQIDCVSQHSICNLVMELSCKRTTHIELLKSLVCLLVVFLESKHHIATELMERVGLKAQNGFISSKWNLEEQWMVPLWRQAFLELRVEVNLPLLKLIDDRYLRKIFQWRVSKAVFHLLYFLGTHIQIHICLWEVLGLILSEEIE